MQLIETTRSKLDDAVSEPILLSKPSHFGEPMYLGVRYIRSPFLALGKFTRYHKENDSFLLIDIYAGEEGRLHPIGYKDWMLEADIVDEGQNQHTYVQPQNKFEKLAQETWGHPFNLNAFYVDQEYQGNGIGTLLVVVSLKFLRSLSVVTLRREGLTPGSRATWRKFGINWEEYTVPFSSVSEHPLIEKTLADFL